MSPDTGLSTAVRLRRCPENLAAKREVILITRQNIEMLVEVAGCEKAVEFLQGYYDKLVKEMSG